MKWQLHLQQVAYCLKDQQNMPNISKLNKCCLVLLYICCTSCSKSIKTILFHIEFNFTNLSVSLFFQMTSATTLIFFAAIAAIVWAFLQYLVIAKIPVQSADEPTDATRLVGDSKGTSQRLADIYEAIFTGAESFLRAEYTICLYFIIIFGLIVFFLVYCGTGWVFFRGITFTLFVFYSK